MSIKTPKFWLERGFISYLLLPLSFLYSFFSQLKNSSQKPHKISKPTICIGNITVGGSGKTPVAIAIGKILKEIDVDFVYLSRGYKAKKIKFGFIESPGKVEETGDEPLLLEEVAPTFIAKNRVSGAKKIDEMAHVEAVIIDDGMQNNSLKKDILFLVVDGKVQFGNGLLFPAGPLRQSIESGLNQADYIVVIGDKDQELQDMLQGRKVINAKMTPKNLSTFSGKKLIAFCGLAHPQKFFSFVEDQGLSLIKSEAFADHHFYSNHELSRLVNRAEKNSAKLITTKKDWVKFSDEFKKKIDFLDVELEIENKEQLKTELKKILIKN